MNCASVSRIDGFNSLLSSVNKCDICPRMCNRRKVLSEMNGNINSKVVFIAEAPGRLGAECTGIPLYGDATGNNFELLLSNIGWRREDVFITNAVLCNPQNENGNNATPTKEEIFNCSYYLNMVLELIHPSIVVTLGIKALDALNNIEKHSYVLKKNVGTLLPWNGTYVFPLYHMSPRATLHRSLTQQRTDFIALSHEVSPFTGLKKQKALKQDRQFDVSRQSKLAAMVEYIVMRCKEISFFKLTKLLYLIDYSHLTNFGSMISDSIYLRMQAGPWIPYLKNVVQESNYIRTTQKGGKPYMISIATVSHFDLSDIERETIDMCIEKYKDRSDAQMRTAAYLTPPMRYIMKQERSGKSMLKTPVLYKNISVDKRDLLQNSNEAGTYTT